MQINNVDICCGLAWGDEAKGKIVTQLIKNKKYDFVCRWSGGSNAGHTVYFNGKKFHSHIIPSGIFLGIKSFIGPDCYINEKDFLQEIQVLQENGFDTTNIFISPYAHVVTDLHKEIDVNTYKKEQGSTGKGIALCAKDKFARIGILVKDLKESELTKYIYTDKLFGDILCEGAQGFWLDINHGNYPFVTSSYTLPYSACSLGFPPQKIRKIYGAAKVYDTRVGVDPDFKDDLLNDNTLNKIAEVGKEFGTTTGRARKVNWLNMNKLIDAINISGSTDVIISKIDVLDTVGVFKYIWNDNIMKCNDILELQNVITVSIYKYCKLVENIIFSDNPESVDFC
jgi:adenylosuccinate synthase